MPAQNYVAREDLMVGTTLPDGTVLEPVPENDACAHAVINVRRAIVRRRRVRSKQLAALPGRR